MELNSLYKKVRTIQTEWSSGNKEDEFAVEAPATGEVVAIVKGASEETTRLAIKAANEEFKNEWRHKTYMERSALLQKCAIALEGHADEIAELEALEMGKPFTQARGDVMVCIQSFRMFSAFALNLPGSSKDEGPALSITSLEPYGVVGGIIPFNWPPIHCGAKIAPALAVGNCIVIKPPEQCPSSIIRITEIINEILPKHVVNVVCGGGAIGTVITASPDIKMVSFTGSPQTALKVLNSMAPNYTPHIMELGGKNPLIIFEDADIELAAKWVMDGAFFNQGEACTAASRILVHKSLEKSLLERLKKYVPKLVVGDPLDVRTHVGPIVTKVQQEKILGYLRIGKDEGAEVLCTAPIPEGEEYKNGYWVAPTVLINVNNKMRVAQEEIFGPVPVIITFDTYEEAIEMANDTPFGLVAGVFSQNLQTCYKASRELDFGIIFMNNYNRQFHSGATAFGGCKASGYGREHNYETVKEFGRMKTLRLLTGIGNINEWFALNEIIKE